MKEIKVFIGIDKNDRTQKNIIVVDESGITTKGVSSSHVIGVEFGTLRTHLLKYEEFIDVPHMRDSQDMLQYFASKGYKVNREYGKKVKSYKIILTK